VKYELISKRVRQYVYSLECTHSFCLWLLLQMPTSITVNVLLLPVLHKRPTRNERGSPIFFDPIGCAGVIVPRAREQHKLDTRCRWYNAESAQLGARLWHVGIYGSNNVMCTPLCCNLLGHYFIYESQCGVEGMQGRFSVTLLFYRDEDQHIWKALVEYFK
jgi:hypothetical protein